MSETEVMLRKRNGSEKGKEEHLIKHIFDVCQFCWIVPEGENSKENIDVVEKREEVEESIKRTRLKKDKD